MSRTKQWRPDRNAPKTKFDLFVRMIFNEMPWQQKHRGDALHPPGLSFGFSFCCMVLFVFALFLVGMKLIVDPDVDLCRASGQVANVLYGNCEPIKGSQLGKRSKAIPPSR